MSSPRSYCQSPRLPLSSSTQATAARAVAAYGTEPQLRQLQEECGELVAAVGHYLRGRQGAVHELAEELADVTIMLAQARAVLEASGQGALIDAEIKRKLTLIEYRLEARAGVARG